MLNMSTLQDRIAEVIKAGFGQAELARITGRTTAAVNQWVRGPTQELKADNALAISRKTGFSAEWLVSGKGPKRAEKPSASSENAIAHIGSHSLRLLPVVEWVRGDEMLSIRNDDLNLRADVDCLTAPGVQSPQAKFFVVPDDAMAPDILRGEYVALDPQPKPLRGDYVLVKSKRTGELMLRQYRPVDEDEFNAVPLNTSKYDPFNSRQHGLELLAVLVGHWSGRRSERH